MATSVEPTTSTAPQAAPASTRLGRLGLAGRNRQLVIAAAAIVVVALVVWLVSLSGERKEAFAARALAQAEAAVDAGNVPQASAELQRVIDNYKGTDAAAEAVLVLNQLRLENGQTQLAITGLRDFLKTGPTGHRAAAAHALLGAALESAAKFADAAAEYQAAADAAESDYLKSEYLLQAGRALVAAGKKDDAAKAYRTILEKYGKAGLEIEAQVRLAELTKGAM